MTKQKKADACTPATKETERGQSMDDINITTDCLYSNGSDGLYIHSPEKYEINFLKDKLSDIAVKAEELMAMIDLCDGDKRCAKNCGEAWVKANAIKIIAQCAVDWRSL